MQRLLDTLASVPVDARSRVLTWVLCRMGVPEKALENLKYYLEEQANQALAAGAAKRHKP